MEKPTKRKKPGNSDDTQISRPDLRFASREKQRKQHKTGPEPHQTKNDCVGPAVLEGKGNWVKLFLLHHSAADQLAWREML